MIGFASFPLVGTIDVGKTRLMFWDLGGQEELQSLWDKVGDIYFFLLEVFLALLELKQHDHLVVMQAYW